MDEFLQAVYQQPDEDGPRLALGEALRAKGDVRGEHIALQFERARAVRRRPIRATRGESWRC